MSSRFSIRNIKTFSITDTDPEKEKEIKAKAEQKKREKKEKKEKEDKEDKEFWDGLAAKIEKMYPGGKLQKKKQLKLPKKTKTKKRVKQEMNTLYQKPYYNKNVL